MARSQQPSTSNPERSCERQENHAHGGADRRTSNDQGAQNSSQSTTYEAADSERLLRARKRWRMSLHSRPNLGLTTAPRARAETLRRTRHADRAASRESRSAGSGLGLEARHPPSRCCACWPSPAALTWPLGRILRRPRQRHCCWCNRYGTPSSSRSAWRKTVQRAGMLSGRLEHGFGGQAASAATGNLQPSGFTLRRHQDLCHGLRPYVQRPIVTAETRKGTTATAGR